MMKRLLPLLLCTVLAACSDSDVKEVKQWMAEVKAQSKVAVAPLSEPKTFVPLAYSAKDIIDPFNPSKLLTEMARAAAKSNNPFKPDLTRRKELLESFPLDTMKMVGTMSKGGVFFGLVQIDKSVHRVVVGQYLGQNFGLVTGVSDSTINIKEVVQDATGEWVERMSKLELQEGKETTK